MGLGDWAIADLSWCVLSDTTLSGVAESLATQRPSAWISVVRRRYGPRGEVALNEGEEGHDFG
jgi:hypothetical protein